MKVDRRRIDDIRCILVIMVLIGLCAFGLNGCLSMFEPKKTDYSTDQQEKIRAYLGIRPPDSQHFLEGYAIPGREPSYVFIFKYEISSVADDISAVNYLRNVLELNDDHAIFAESSNDIPYFTQLGYEFTHKINYKIETAAWGDIVYKVSESTILLGIWWGYP